MITRSRGRREQPYDLNNACGDTAKRGANEEGDADVGQSKAEQGIGNGTQNCPDTGKSCSVSCYTRLRRRSRGRERCCSMCSTNISTLRFKSPKHRMRSTSEGSSIETETLTSAVDQDGGGSSKRVEMSVPHCRVCEENNRDDKLIQTSVHDEYFSCAEQCNATVDHTYVNKDLNFRTELKTNIDDDKRNDLSIHNDHVDTTTGNINTEEHRDRGRITDISTKEHHTDKGKSGISTEEHNADKGKSGISTHAGISKQEHIADKEKTGMFTQEDHVHRDRIYDHFEKNPCDNINADSSSAYVEKYTKLSIVSETTESSERANNDPEAYTKSNECEIIYAKTKDIIEDSALNKQVPTGNEPAIVLEKSVTRFEDQFKAESVCTSENEKRSTYALKHEVSTPEQKQDKVDEDNSESGTQYEVPADDVQPCDVNLCTNGEKDNSCTSIHHLLCATGLKKTCPLVKLDRSFLASVKPECNIWVKVAVRQYCETVLKNSIMILEGDQEHRPVSSIDKEFTDLMTILHEMTGTARSETAYGATFVTPTAPNTSSDVASRIKETPTEADETRPGTAGADTQDAQPDTPGGLDNEDDCWGLSPLGTRTAGLLYYFGQPCEKTLSPWWYISLTGDGTVTQDSGTTSRHKTCEQTDTSQSSSITDTINDNFGTSPTDNRVKQANGNPHENDLPCQDGMYSDLWNKVKEDLGSISFESLNDLDDDCQWQSELDNILQGNSIGYWRTDDLQLLGDVDPSSVLDVLVKPSEGSPVDDYYHYSSRECSDQSCVTSQGQSSTLSCSGDIFYDSGTEDSSNFSSLCDSDDDQTESEISGGAPPANKQGKRLSLLYALLDRSSDLSEHGCPGEDREDVMFLEQDLPSSCLQEEVLDDWGICRLFDVDDVFPYENVSKDVYADYSLTSKIKAYDHSFFIEDRHHKDPSGREITSCSRSSKKFSPSFPYRRTRHFSAPCTSSPISRNSSVSRNLFSLESPTGNCDRNDSRYSTSPWKNICLGSGIQTSESDDLADLSVESTVDFFMNMSSPLKSREENRN